MVVKKIAILFSGNGTNLQNLIEKLHNKVFDDTKIEVALTISNKKDVYGIKRSQKFGIEPIVIENKAFSSREEFDKELVSVIKKQNIDLVVLAGFMRILSSVFTQNVKAINIHPSLLPLFKGANAIEESFNSDEKFGGATVHYVSEELDGGEIIIQKSFEKTLDMNIDEFEKHIHKIEYDIFPKAVMIALAKQR